MARVRARGPGRLARRRPTSGSKSAKPACRGGCVEGSVGFSGAGVRRFVVRLSPAAAAPWRPSAISLRVSQEPFDPFPTVARAGQRGGQRTAQRRGAGMRGGGGGRCQVADPPLLPAQTRKKPAFPTRKGVCQFTEKVADPPVPATGWLSRGLLNPGRASAGGEQRRRRKSFRKRLTWGTPSVFLYSPLDTHRFESQLRGGWSGAA